MKCNSYTVDNSMKLDYSDTTWCNLSIPHDIEMRWRV